MATIVKRKTKFSVVYRYEDETGTLRQKWETFGSHKEAVKRKNEVEYKQQTNSFMPPTSYKVRDLLYDFVLLYGKDHWALSTYTMNKSLIDNYINPKIGDLLAAKVTARTIDEYYNSLKSTPAIGGNGHKQPGMVSTNTIHEIHKILRCAFNQAVKWDSVEKNPVDKVSKPKPKHKKREIWTDKDVFTALGACDDTRLALSIQLAFACTLRLGEVTGLQWDCVDVSDQAIESDNASIYIHQELSRVSKEAMEQLNNKDIKFIFPAQRPGGTSSLVLKTPKTESSVRRIYVPITLAHALRRWKKEQAELRDALQNDFYDYNLVVTHTNGRPVEHRIIDKIFRELQEREGYPVVVFHSLRHSSATYKLKLANGSMNDVKDDGGWATTQMIAKVYAHTFDDDRKIMAQKFDDAFYGGAGFDKQQAKPITAPTAAAAPVISEMDISAIIALIQSNPQIAQALQAAAVPVN